MKKYLLISLILAGILYAPHVFAEQINFIDVNIKVNQDSSIYVTEVIDYDFGNQQKHGIFRDIPVKYKARGGNYNIRISNITVTDENFVPYTKKISYSGSDMEIKIGDADTYVTGKKTYIINYLIKRGFNYFEDYDELYWNVTGNKWPVEIKSAKATINFPQTAEQVQIKCFTGLQGSANECETAQLYNNKVIFNTANLDINEGLTAVVGLPKGLISKPPIEDVMLWIIIDNWSLLLPIVVLILCYLYWRKQGKDPQGRGTIIAQFDAPDRLSPAEIGTLYDNKLQGKDISAEIINLAIKGFIKINRLENGKIFKSADYELQRLKPIDSKQLSDIEWDIMVGLFESGSNSKDKIKISELQNKFHTDFKKIKNKIWKVLIKREYYPENYKSAGSVMIIGSIIGIFAVISAMSLFILFLGYYLLISLIISFIIIIIFGIFMPKITKKGAITKEYILGLKEYLMVAEKDRLKFHNAPAKNPQEFERLLPYAIVLGVEKEWAAQFKDIYKEIQPSWYSDPNIQSFSAFNLADSLSGFKAASAAGLTSTSSSSSSGSASGSSGLSGGGGFSGGGFGGGGGGSW